MRKLFVTLIILYSIASCSLIQPVYIVIENKSDYTVRVTAEKGLMETLVLKKGKGDFTLVPPGPLSLTFTIHEIGYSKEYEIRTDYLEKKKIVFRL